MRPLRLSLKGFTSYRDQVEVDFCDLDLFAITGPTGAGKSSLVDGITYALYGRVPRLGSEIKEFIHQGSERLRVSLEFVVDGQRYRVVRSTAHKGQAQVQLERYDESQDSWVPEADRVAEVNERVRQLLGLDFDGFTRSVLLPQGRFAEFLAGEPQQRRKVLEELLRLDVYKQVQQRAGELARDAEAKAELLERQLIEQYADATPERLRELQGKLQHLENRSQAARQERGLANDARSAAEMLARSLAQERLAAQELAQAQERLAVAERTLREGEEQLRRLDQEIARAQEAIAVSGYDAEAHRRWGLQLALTKALEKAEAALVTKRQQEQAHRRALQALRAQGEAARKALAVAQTEMASREAAYEELKQQNMAMGLRRSLRAGEECPVCGQQVAVVPPAEHVGLDAAAWALQEAKQRLEQARQGAQKAEQAAAVAQQAGEGLQAQVEALEEERQHWLSESRSLGVEELRPSADIEAALKLLDEAKARYESLQAQWNALRVRREALAARYGEAKGQVAGLLTVAQEKETALHYAGEAVVEARQRLLAAAHPWPEISSAAVVGQDVLPLLAARLSALEVELRGLEQEIGLKKGEIERIRQGIEKAREMRREMEELRQQGSVARTLADLLRADHFVKWLMEAVLAALARNGSQHLREVSSGRYQFDVEGQEFLVIDHWNADEVRSVRTLSGGETFLASLALALALAESLPELGPGRRSSALESLFLDEGFGNLDEETLDVVASALEGVMSQRRRMVGVVTHLHPLAERLPIRINVVKSETGSRVYVD